MVDSILVFIEQNSQWAGVLIFVIALLESLAIVGILVPGWVILVGVGSLIGADRLSFYPIATAAYLGAVIGEYLSFLLGYHYHNQFLNLPWVKRHQRIIDVSETFFQTHGIAGVFVGRFFGPTRAVVPFLAGISNMSRLTFTWVNLVSGLIWAPLYLIPGILLGAAFQLETELAYQLVFSVFLVILTYIFTFNVSRRYFKKGSGIKRPTRLTLVLWWAIASTCSLIFTMSPFAVLLVDILSVLASKL